MKIDLKKPFSYSDDGINVTRCEPGVNDIPDKFVKGVIDNGIGTKAKQAPSNKAKQAPKNKAK